MAKMVKNDAVGAPARKRRSGRVARKNTEVIGAAVTRAKISTKHQVTIGKAPFEEAGFKSGDVVAIRALGPGRVEMTKLDALFAKHRGRVKTGGDFRDFVEASRNEWN